MRGKNKVSKLITAKNDPSENRKLAQIGKLWLMPACEKAYYWRAMTMLCNAPGRNDPDSKEAKKKRAATLKKSSDEIGATVGKAVAEGNWRYLKSLADAVKLINERFDWNVKTRDDAINLILWDRQGSKFKSIDPLREAIVREYFMVIGGPVKKARKTRKAFMGHIEKFMPDAICERTFDRACTALGIRWRK